LSSTRPSVCQSVERLADRQPADAELAGDLLLPQRLAGLQRSREDHLAQPLVRRLLRTDQEIAQCWSH